MNISQKYLNLWRGGLKCLLGFCLLWFQSSLFIVSAAPASTKDAYTVRRWGVEEGLPEGIVTSVNIFDDGFLWLTTPRHVVRFDGAEFKSLSQEAYPEKKPRRFNCIISDRNGTVWVSGEDGVMRNLGTEWISVRLEGGLEYDKDEIWHVETPDGRLDQKPHLELFWIKEAPDGILWLASNSGMYRFEGDEFHRAVLGGDSSPEFFTSACMDGEGAIWLVGDGRLFLFDEGGYQPVDFPCGDGREALFQVFAGVGGSLWGKRVDGKIFRCNDEEWYEAAPPGLRHMDLLEQDNGEIWFGVVEGLYRSNLKNNKMLVRAGIDKAHDVRCLKTAVDGSLWAGSGNGLFQLKPRTVRMFAVEPSGQDQTVTALLPDGTGGFWAGVEGHGILLGSAGEFRSFKTDPPVLNYATVSAMCMKRDKTFWVGTRDDHLWQVMPDGEVDQTRSMEGYASRGITALAESADGQLWVGTREGLLKRDVNNRLNPMAGPDDTILALYADSKNGIWAGTQCSGLWYIDSSGGQTFLREPDGLPSDTIRALHQDTEGRLWLATSGGLALLLDTNAQDSEPPGRVISFTREQGLPFDDIWQMLDDGQGNIWLGTRQRIMRIVKSDMIDVAEGRKKVLTVRTFGRDDGLDAGLVGGDHNGPLAVRTQDGLLWFATHHGLAMINPAEQKDDSSLIQVYIEEISARLHGGVHFIRRMAEQGLTKGDALPAEYPVVDLPAGSRNISFRYTAPVFVNPEQVLFRTRLDGYENDWSAPSTIRQVTYSRLPPGDYRFRVMVSLPTGGWLESANGIRFRELPYFWQTVWFRFLLGLLSLMVVGTLVGLLVQRHEKIKREAMRRRAEERERVMARKQAVERERSRIARDIHDDLGAGLTQVALQSELGQVESEHPDKVRLRLDNIFRTASSLAQGLNEIVWAVNPRNDTLDSMLTYLENYSDEYLRSSGLRFRSALPVEIPERTVSSMVRHHLFCALREALHNAVKYAGACEVRLQVSLKGQVLRIELADTGTGFDPDSIGFRAGKHNGLENMKQRMDEVGGKFELNTSPDHGTQLTFQVELHD